MSTNYLIKSFKLLKLFNYESFPKRISLNNLRNSTSSFSSSVNIETEEKLQKKKTTIIPKITLINGSELSITTLEEAQKLSKRRDLKLVKIIDLDTKTQRPVYKLMTGAQYHAEDLKQRALKKETKLNSVKGEKVLMINHNIYEHDLHTQLKKVNKWLDKVYEVRVVINGDISNIEKAESVYNIIKEAVNQDAKIVQKRLKGSDIKFQILPPKRKKDDENL